MMLIDPRPLASYFSIMFDLNFEEVVDSLEYFFANCNTPATNGFFVGDSFNDYVFPKFLDDDFPQQLYAGDSGKVDDYII